MEPLALVSVAARFPDVAGLNPGQTESFPCHCHVLEDHEMMRQYLLRY